MKEVISSWQRRKVKARNLQARKAACKNKICP
jgi:hypothetical protein